MGEGAGKGAAEWETVVSHAQSYEDVCKLLIVTITHTHTHIPHTHTHTHTQ